MNDPNGLVYLDGTWHAFFQYNPEGIDWGNMSWGHSSSADLEHWRAHPVALRYSDDEQIYSGSVVAEDDGTLTAIYTSAYARGVQAQSRAVSDDGGDTWTPDASNPVLDRGSSDFRDPKIVRMPTTSGSRWVMVAVEAVERRVLFYASDDLRIWRETGSFGPVGPDGVVWECPDLVRLPLDNDPARAQWVLLLSTNPVGADPDPAGSAMHYVVGSFDGGTFTAQNAELERLDHGRDFYAGVTFDSAPGDQAIMLAWMSNWRYAHVVPATTWRGAMSLPRRLSLRTIDGQPRLVQHPASPVVRQLADTAALSDPAKPITIAPHALIELRWTPGTEGKVRLHLAGDGDAAADIVFDPAAKTLSVTRAGEAAQALHPDFASTSTAPLRGESRTGRLLVSLDGPLLEVFINDGETTVSNLVTLGTGPVTLTVTTEKPGSFRTLTLVIAEINNSESAGEAGSAQQSHPGPHL